jgi:hypothetical protein
MRRLPAVATIVALFVAPLAADVTISTTTTIEGGMAAVAGGGMSPKIVTRIKGNRSRTEIQAGNDQTMVMLMDAATGQTIMLRPDQKTAQVIDLADAMPPGAAQMPMPAIESSVKRTGQTREINGARCDEYAVSIRMDMAPMAAGRADMPPAAAAMLKDLRMNMTGSAWVARSAPGAAEYAAFQAATAKIAAGAASASRRGGLPPGLDRILTGFSEAPGIPYMTEMVMSMEGNRQLMEVMKQMGQMKIITQVTAVSTEPLADALFTVPDDYKLISKEAGR